MKWENVKDSFIYEDRMYIQTKRGSYYKRPLTWVPGGSKLSGTVNLEVITEKIYRTKKREHKKRLKKNKK